MTINLDFKHKGKIIHIPVKRYRTLDELLDCPPNTVIIVDEASAYFHARYWRETPSEFLSMVAQGRKGGIDIIASTQRYKSVDIEFREKCHNTFLVEKHFEIFFVATKIKFDIFTESIIARNWYDFWTLFNKDRLYYNTFEVISSGTNAARLFEKVTTGSSGPALENVTSAEGGGGTREAISDQATPIDDVSREQRDLDTSAGVAKLSPVSQSPAPRILDLEKNDFFARYKNENLERGAAREAEKKPSEY